MTFITRLRRNTSSNKTGFISVVFIWYEHVLLEISYITAVISNIYEQSIKIIAHFTVHLLPGSMNSQAKQRRHRERDLENNMHLTATTTNDTALANKAGFPRPKAIIVRAALLGAVLMYSFAGVGCDDGSATADNSSLAIADQVPAPRALSKGIILDSTTSTDGQFCEEVRSCLISKLRSFGTEDSDLTDGADAIPALDLWVYVVGDNPTASYSSQSIHISLPAVGQLLARPSLQDEDALNAVHQWNDEQDRYIEEFSAWKATYDEEITKLEAFDIATDQYSGIFSTVAAVSAVVPQGTDILLASDLENNRDAQTTDSLEGSNVYIIQPTPTGDMAYSDALFADAVSYLSTIGVSEQDIARYRAEQTAEAIQAFMEGK
jgi:hypothetical protein